MRLFERLIQPVVDGTFATISWLQLKSDGDVAIFGHENVASVTDNAVGDYTATWTIPYATASSYAITLGTSQDAAALTHRYMAFQSITATSVRTLLRDAGGGAGDPQMTYLIALGEF